MSHSLAEPSESSGTSTSGTAKPTAAEPLGQRGAVPFDKTTPEEENSFHHYTGNAIPWFVRAIWIIFWCYAITYFVLWLLPSLQSELLTPP
jgi:hypothetical protein